MGSDQYLRETYETNDKGDLNSGYYSVINSVQSLKLGDQECSEPSKIELWSETDTLNWVLNIADKISFSVIYFSYFNFKIPGTELIKLTYKDICHKAMQPNADSSALKKITEEIWNNLRRILSTNITNKSQNSPMSLTNEINIKKGSTSSYLVKGQNTQRIDKVMVQNITDSDDEFDDSSNKIPLSEIQKSNRRPESTQTMSRNNNNNSKHVKLLNKREIYDRVRIIAELNGVSEIDYAFFNFLIPGNEYIKLNKEQLLNKARLLNSNENVLSKLVDAILRDIEYIFNNNMQTLPIQISNNNQNKTKKLYIDDSTNKIPLSENQKSNQNPESTQTMSRSNKNNSKHIELLNKREIYNRVHEIAELNGVSGMDYAFFNFLMPGNEYIKLNKEQLLNKARLPNYKETILNKLVDAILRDIEHILNNNMQILPIQISNNDHNKSNKLFAKQKSKTKNNDLKNKIKKVSVNQCIQDEEVEDLPTHIPIFLYYLLLNPKYNSIIEFTSREEGVFKFKNTNAVAKLWGKVKHNKTMSYEKFSRAVRYYRQQGIIKSVPKQRLTYRFNSKYLKNIKSHCMHGK